jgi:hypothetical protein
MYMLPLPEACIALSCNGSPEAGYHFIAGIDFVVVIDERPLTAGLGFP